MGAHVMSVLYPVVMGVMWGHTLCLYSSNLYQLGERCYVCA